MGWAIPWVSSAGTDFNRDFGISTDKGEDHALSVLLRDGDDVYRTYWTTARGCETLGPIWTLLDLTPLGRQENWEAARRPSRFSGGAGTTSTDTAVESPIPLLI